MKIIKIFIILNIVVFTVFLTLDVLYLLSDYQVDSHLMSFFYPCKIQIIIVHYSFYSIVIISSILFLLQKKVISLLYYSLYGILLLVLISEFLPIVCLPCFMKLPNEIFLYTFVLIEFIIIPLIVKKVFINKKYFILISVLYLIAFLLIKLL
mgnify:CR=1 FL=1